MKEYKPADSMLSIEDTVLVITDVQEGIKEYYQNPEMVNRNIQKIIKIAEIYQIPIIIVEQGRFGKTVEPIRSTLRDLYDPIIKSTFSCFANEDFRERLEQTGRKQVLLTGILTDICVAQTALDLLENGYETHLVADAASSNNQINHETAVNRLREEGVIITATQMLMYELTKTADSPGYRIIACMTPQREK
jgi:nicotinamidase-related amidase